MDNTLCFDLESLGLKFETDFLIRVRHFVSDEIRYPLFRVLLTPVMFFDRVSIIPRNYIDFGECVEIGEEFHLKLEVGFDETILSNSYMNVSSIMKAQGINVAGEKVIESGLVLHTEKEDDEKQQHFSIDVDDDEENDSSEVEKQSKIEKLIEKVVIQKELKNEENLQKTALKNDDREEELSDEDDYLKNLEKRV